MLLEQNRLKPMGKSGLGIEAGDLALRRVEDDVQRLAVGLTLHAE